MNFDRVAHIYDATRGMPDTALEQIADCIVRVTDAGSDTCFLELGIGTGRIAIPVARGGYAYTGVDISEKMTDIMRRRAEAEGVRIDLRYADVTALPFPDDSFDVVVAVHILHLVPEWQKVLEEVRRVLKPRGHFVLGQEHESTEDTHAHIRGQWRKFVEEAGTTMRPPYGTWEHVDEALTQMGCYSAVYQAARLEGTFIPRELLQQVRERVFSGTWDVPEEALQVAHERMLPWIEETYGNADAPQTFTGNFRVLTAAFPK